MLTVVIKSVILGGIRTSKMVLSVVAPLVLPRNAYRAGRLSTVDLLAQIYSLKLISFRIKL